MGELKEIVMTKELYIAYDILAKAKYDCDKTHTEQNEKEKELHDAVTKAITVLDKVLFE